jgi:hypothetical protein
LLIQLGAGSLSALCFAFSWRAFQRCRAITSLDATSSISVGGLSSSPTTEVGSDPPTNETEAFEQRLEERESNAALNLAKRNVKALAQAAFTGGLGLFFWALTGGKGHHQEAVQALALGGVGAIACLGLRRQIGSLAESWRDATNRRNRANREPARQGVDQSERTG